MPQVEREHIFEHILKETRQTETASRLSDWLRSLGLKAPT
jgi:hypothetical protein